MEFVLFILFIGILYFFGKFSNDNNEFVEEQLQENKGVTDSSTINSVKATIAFEELQWQYNKSNISYEVSSTDEFDIICTLQFLDSLGKHVGVVTSFGKRNLDALLHIEGLLKIDNEISQFNQVLEVCNDFNSRYVFYKMYLEEDGRLIISFYRRLDFHTVDLMIAASCSILNTLETTDYVQRLQKIKWS